MKMMYELKPFERIDDLLTDGLKIIQNENEFCFSLDAVLLAHFANVHRKDCGLDLGTGTGVIPMLLANKAAKIHALEINPVTVDIAKRNVILNKLSEKIIVQQADYRNIKEIFPAQFADFVIVNPPYRPLQKGYINDIDGVAKARHEITATLADVIAAAHYTLRFHGRFTMVHLPERLAEIIVQMRQNNIEPKRIRFVQPKTDKPPNMVLIEGVHGGAIGGLKVDKPLIVHNDDGTYTEELIKYYYPD